MKRCAQSALVFCMLAFLISCSSPNSNKGTIKPPPAGKQFVLTATVDSAQFTCNPTVTMTKLQPDTTKYLVDIQGTSATLGQSMELTFQCPSSVTSHLNLGPASVHGQYFGGAVGSNTVWTSMDTASVTLNAFSPADTTLSLDFSFTAWGGASSSLQTVKKISAGTLRQQ